MSTGLEGVLVGDTSRSFVDGAAGRLSYRGYDVRELAGGATYEEIAHLLWYDELPSAAQLAALTAQLRAERALPPIVGALLPILPRAAHPMAILRTAISALGCADPAADDLSRANLQRQALALTAVTPTIVAAWEHVRHDRTPIAPRADLGHAANFLYMLTGREPESAAVAALDAYLVCLADHGYNASTFAARVTFASLSDIYSAVTAGIGTLKGDAHGRANQRAMEQFIEAHASGDIAAWYRAKRASGARIMGIGHRVYKSIDPRATILGPLAARMAATSPDGFWYDVARAVEQLTLADPYFATRKLYANVDFYAAVILTMLGLPIDQFTPVFALARMAGWTAHVIEQSADNRLIRPAARYVGPAARPFVPLAAR